MIRMFVVGIIGMLAFTGCEGTQTGRSLFGTPSNNVISSITLSFPTAPNRRSGTQALALQVAAFDRWGNRITVLYNNNITLTSTDASCEIAFTFYQTPGSTTAQTLLASLTYNSPQDVGVVFNPSCGPSPVTITASSPGVPNATISF